MKIGSLLSAPHICVSRARWPSDRIAASPPYAVHLGDHISDMDLSCSTAAMSKAQWEELYALPIESNREEIGRIRNTEEEGSFISQPHCHHHSSPAPTLPPSSNNPFQLADL